MVFLDIELAQEQFTRKCNGEDVILHRRDIVYICSYKRVLKVFLSNSDTLEYYGKIRLFALFESVIQSMCERSLTCS